MESLRRQPRSPANKAVLWVCCITGFFEYMSAAAVSPFFAVYAQDTTGASDLLVGVAFAAFPAAQALASPLVPLLSGTLGRVPVLYAGLVLEAFTEVAFGYSSTMPYWVGFRAVQGVGSALVSGPATALLLAHSSDVAEDIGIAEAVTGASYMVGPALGGILFKQLGFRCVFLALGFGQMVALAAVAVSLRGLTPVPTNNGRPANETASVGDADSPGEHEEGATAVGRLMRERAVGIAAAVTVLATANMSWTDVAWPQHFRATVGFGARDTGLGYAVPSFTYMCITPFFGAVTRRWGLRNVMAGGCVLFAVSQILCGPAPPLLLVGGEEGGGRRLAWLFMAPGVVMYGLPIMAVVLTAVPLMDAALKARGASAGSASFSTADREALEDALSAVTNTAEALGAVLGPVLGGVALELMPVEPEPGCDLDDGGDRGSGACVSSFAWVSSTFAALFLLAAVGLVGALPRDAPRLPALARRSTEKQGDALVSPLLGDRAVC